MTEIEFLKKCFEKARTIRELADELHREKGGVLQEGDLRHKDATEQIVHIWRVAVDLFGAFRQRIDRAEEGEIPEAPEMPPTRFDIERAPQKLLVAESAALARVTPRTIRRWISLGYLHATKPAGGRVLIDRESLRQFIEQGRI